MSYVTDIPAADADVARRHFAQRLSLETDCADVEHGLRGGKPDFVLLHTIGQPEAFRRRHIPGSIHLPYGQMTEQRMSEWPPETLFVVYCAGPHCNGADRAALRLATLGRPVKLMLGGMTGWEDEGFALVKESS